MGPWLSTRLWLIRCRPTCFQNTNPRKPREAIPSGTPTPTPIAIGKLAEDPEVLVGNEGSVEVFDGEDAKTLVGFEVGLAEKVVVTISLKSLVPADEDDVTGGNPRMAPNV